LNPQFRFPNSGSDIAPLAGDPAEAKARMHGAIQKCDTFEG
jgi:hypothetical protein